MNEGFCATELETDEQQRSEREPQAKPAPDRERQLELRGHEVERIETTPTDNKGAGYRAEKRKGVDPRNRLLFLFPLEEPHDGMCGRRVEVLQ